MQVLQLKYAMKVKTLKLLINANPLMLAPVILRILFHKTDVRFLPGNYVTA